jgi:hypothetical protein
MRFWGPRDVGILGLVVTLLLAGCGPSAVSATDWAAKVCSTLTPWRAQITGLNQQAQQKLATASTPEQTRTQLVALLSGAQAATENARAAVAAAGTPDVDGGDVVAQRFVTALQKVRDAYAHALTALNAISTTDPAYYDKVADVLTALDNEYAQSGVDTSSLNSPDLQAAFQEQTACQ